ncbi:MAG: hypothetical protein NZ942_01215, partial [Candidatus Aenigmarchaeota archaeon]|nr:hypothetical protein [Candidatus Aenigmarchaeota archaeon]
EYLLHIRNFGDITQIKGSIDISSVFFLEIIGVKSTFGVIVIKLIPIFIVTTIVFLLSKKFGVGKEAIR